MSTQEIELSRNPGTLPVWNGDPWSTPGGAASAHADPSLHESPLRKLHRLLRGRYPLAITLAVICAIAGGLLGWLTQKPQWRSIGIIQISPNMGDLRNLDQVMPMYHQYVKTQVDILQSRRLADQAMEKEEWRGTGQGIGAKVVANFLKRLEVQHDRDSQLIFVTYLDEDPRVAQAAVVSITRAYQDHFRSSVQDEDRKTEAVLESRRRDALNQLRQKKEQILSLSQVYGSTDLETMLNAKLNSLVQMESMLNQAQYTLAAAEAAMTSKNAATTGPSMRNNTSPEELARGGDREMVDLLQKKRDLEWQVQRQEKILGSAHRLVQQNKEELKLILDAIEKRMADYRQQPYGLQISPDGSSTIAVTPSTIEQLKSRVDYLRKLYEQEKTSTNQIGETRIKIQTLKNEIEAAQQTLSETERALDNLRVQAMISGAGRVSVLQQGDMPVEPTNDPRRKWGALGVIFGGALPMLAFMLIGLFDQRFRYSDDTGPGMSGVTLLGILPNLPDRLGDPEQAAVAAHCVHQIRTMLQINGDGKRSVFTVTSASPQDGKTSLTLALGLSFAAAGSRTLLIDCDLVGGGLTTRLNIAATEGILEAITHRNLLPFVQGTEIADLSMLPVGSAHAQHASVLSPGALRRLVSEARHHFDTVLIDTGPILGSIEASLVATSSDAVILTVARGQQRPLVEKSLAHLRRIGANLAGLVFNRAQAKDFERSVSRLSLRSVERIAPARALGSDGASTAPSGTSFGPVARAVANTTSKSGNGVES